MLVVEDEPDAQEVLLHHLHNEANVETRVADSGITRIQVLATFMPDLILLDVRMPKMNGISFLRHMRSEPQYERIPVVIVTGEEFTAAERQELAGQSMAIVGKGAGTRTGSATRARRRGRATAARAEDPAIVA